jgi:putative transposase
MKKRRNAEQIARLLREADRDLAKGLTVSDVCRKLGLSANTYYRWRQHHDPARVDEARRLRELQAEVERLKRLVAELMLDKQMLQDIAKKSGDADPAARRRRLPVRALWRFAAPGQPGPGPVALHAPLPPPAAA